VLWWAIHKLRASKPRVRIQAARILGEVKHGKAVPALIRALQDEEKEVQDAAAAALSAIRHPASIEPLAKFLQGRPDSAAAEAVGAFGAQAGKALLPLLEQEDKNVRRWAVHALGLAGDESAVGPLIRCLKDRRADVRKEAADALGRIGTPEAVQALLGALDSRDAETRRATARALARVPGEQSLSALAALAEDSDETVQLAAVRALGTIGGMQAAVRLRPALESAKKAVREAARTALESMGLQPGTAEDRASLAVLSGDFEAAAREGAAATEALVRALASRDDGTRLRAVQALYRLRDGRAAHSLVQALGDHDPSVRQAAVEALSALGSPAIDPLIDALVASQKLAAIVLGRISAPAAARPLAEAIARNREVPPDNPVPLEIAQASAEALEKMLLTSPGAVVAQDLSFIAAIPDVRVASMSGPGNVALDCSALRTRAEQELARRGPR